MATKPNSRTPWKIAERRVQEHHLDATLEDVYARIGDVFRRELGIDDFVIYEVNENQRDMAAVYPQYLMYE